MLCSERKLGKVDENREPRHLLDEVWNDGGVRYCLEQALWHFAMRSSRFDYNPDVEPDWGYPRAFSKPIDWVATGGVFQDEFMREPLVNYADEIMYWFTDRDVIFVKYISTDENFGLNFANWPASFTDFVKAYFASRIIRKMPGGTDKVDDICHAKKGVMAKALMIAKNKAAMTQPVTFPTRGTWARARFQGRLTGRSDGGNPSSLIG